MKKNRAFYIGVILQQTGTDDDKYFTVTGRWTP